MKNVDFWDVAPGRSCVNRRFGGTDRLHLQGRKIRSSHLLTLVLARGFYYPEDGDDKFLRKFVHT
jgi:hypothetical protein